MWCPAINLRVICWFYCRAVSWELFFPRHSFSSDECLRGRRVITNMPAGSGALAGIWARAQTTHRAAGTHCVDKEREAESSGERWSSTIVPPWEVWDYINFRTHRNHSPKPPPITRLPLFLITQIRFLINVSTDSRTFQMSSVTQNMFNDLQTKRSFVLFTCSDLTRIRSELVALQEKERTVHIVPRVCLSQ